MKIIKALIGFIVGGIIGLYMQFFLSGILFEILAQNGIYGSKSVSDATTTDIMNLSARLSILFFGIVGMFYGYYSSKDESQKRRIIRKLTHGLLGLFIGVFAGELIFSFFALLNPFFAIISPDLVVISGIVGATFAIIKFE